MRLFSYKLTNDTGFAPNPFFGRLTLATCKPGIRRTKGVGDWIAGFTSRQLCGDKVGQERLIFLMKVSEIMSIAEYFHAPRHKNKIPKQLAKDPKDRLGDNIYKPRKGHAREIDDFDQVPNESHGMGSKKRDLGGKNVLISDHFYYFGRDAIVIPNEFRPAIPRGQSGYGVETKSNAEVDRFIRYIEENHHEGRRGLPHAWDDASRTRSCGSRKSVRRKDFARKCGA